MERSYMAQVNEEELLTQCLKGDSRSFDELVRRYHIRAYHAALGFLGNHDDALDVTQDAFSRAWTHIDQFREDKPFYPWFYQILKRLCFNRLKQRQRHAPAETPEQSDPPAPVECSDPSLIAETNDTKALVWQAVESLPVKHREAIVLRHFQQLSYEEIADLLLISKGTVMSRLYYARLALKDKLNGLLD